MHIPVMVNEILEALKVGPGKIYLDGTIGGGGHTEAILTRAPDTKIVGIDRDKEAIDRISKRLKSYIDEKRLSLIQGNFKEVATLLKEDTLFDGALLDFGFSSFQIDNPKRGFSFQKEGPLDMRMDQNQKLTAADLIQHLEEKEMADLFFTYGEERFSRKIAAAIVRRRGKNPFRTTLDLANFIAAITPQRHFRIHPATRVFQALRIVVNDELTGLSEVLVDFVKKLKKEGRLAVISFHSLEDRLVKQTFVTLEKPCICPPDFNQCMCGKSPLGKRVTKKPLIPSSKEILMNPRARSAKLRVLVRC